MAKSPEEMAAAMVANMKGQTGRTLAQWMELAKSSGESKHGQIVKHLKTEHGLGHGYANLVAAKTLEGPGGAKSGDDLVGAQYAGKKEGLRPIYDAVIAAVGKLGKDVEVSPKKTYVSLRRSKQFALVQPSTATRVDIGLCLKGDAPTDRLEDAGSWNGMVSHRVRVTDAMQVDAELKRWLKEAYGRA